MKNTMINCGLLSSLPKEDLSEIHNRNNNIAFVMFAGGIESTVSLLWALDHYKQVEAIVVDYNQQHSVELTRARQLLNIFDIKNQSIKITFPDDFWGIKNRLTRGQACLMTSIAALNISHKGADIVHGILRSDDYGDCNRDFLDSLANVLFHPDDEDKIGIATPLRALHGKADVFAKAYIYGIPIDLTWTCRSPYKNQPCGQCVQCKQRLSGFHDFLEKYGISECVFFDWQSVCGSPYHPSVVNDKKLKDLSMLFHDSGAFAFSKPCYIYSAPDDKQHISTTIKRLGTKQLKKNGKIGKAISVHGYFDDRYRWEIVLFEDGTVASTDRIPNYEIIEESITRKIVDPLL